jgi:hypothetical protein
MAFGIFSLPLFLKGKGILKEVGESNEKQSSLSFIQVINLLNICVRLYRE